LLLLEIKIDISQLQGYAKRLKSLSKSAFPVAIRQTLNDAAFDVKGKSMPKSAGSKFKKRSPNFFKANSKAVQAKGFNVKTMSSEVGFFSNNLRGANNRAVKDLEEQEHGGTIDKKQFIAEEGARVGGTGLIRSNRYLKKLPSLTNRVAVSQAYGRIGGKLRRIGSNKQRFIRAAFLAKKKYNGFVLGNKNKNGARTLSIISSITSKNGKVIIKRTALYSVKAGRRVKVNATNFMQRASYESGLKMDKMFIENAQERFVKHLKK
jgi:hypothetical protein